MAEVVFCFSTLSFLTWVVVLKSRIDGMQQRIDELQTKLHKQSRKYAPKVSFKPDPAVWPSRVGTQGGVAYAP